jgi:hypothetical protein
MRSLCLVGLLLVSCVAVIGCQTWSTRLVQKPEAKAPGEPCAPDRDERIWGRLIPIDDPAGKSTAQVKRSQLEDFTLKAGGLAVNNVVLTEAVIEGRSTIRVRASYRNTMPEARSFRLVLVGLGDTKEILWAGNVEGQAAADSLGVLDETSIAAEPGTLKQTAFVSLRLLDRTATSAARWGKVSWGSPHVEPPEPPAEPLRGKASLLQITITNKKTVKVDFEVSKFGPSGLGGVDVYLTADDGRTWEKVTEDVKVVLPKPGEGEKRPSQGSVLVPLPREGITYGISLVVKSRAGLSKAPPKPGDEPQMRVELDTTPPDAELYAPVADPNKRDALILRWKATDKNLANNPITLEWAPQKIGPWSVIGAAELPNTGQYSWQVPNEVPPTVYLRLTVRDAAGNTGVAQTPEPVLVDLAVPEVTIVR